MYSVVSFVPSDRAKSNEKGHFGYLSVKGMYNNVIDAEIKASEIINNNNSEIISIVFGDQYIPCVNYDCLNNNLNTKDLVIKNNIITNQLEINNDIINILEKNIKSLKDLNICNQNILKYNNLDEDNNNLDEDNKDEDNNNLDEKKVDFDIIPKISVVSEMTATQDNLNKTKKTNMEKIKKKIKNIIKF